jgi:hypothetical protein
VLSVDADDVVKDKLDVGLPRVLCCRTAFSTPRADCCVDGCVKYADSHVEDYPLPDGDSL